MAFLTTSDIISSLQSGADSAQVGRDLAKIEAQLLGAGFVFSDPSPSTKLIRPSGYNIRRIFKTSPYRSLTSVDLRTQINVAGTTQTEYTDYIRINHLLISGYSVGIELLEQEITEPAHLALTAKWGMYIDFSTTNTASTLLKAGIIDFVSNVLYARSADSVRSAGIIRAKTGESDVAYSETLLSYNGWNILGDPDFQQVLSYFFEPELL